jgi:CHAT domain-containing protein
MARASRSKLTDTQFAAHKARLQEIGWELYEQLFTPQLRQAYRALRQLRVQEPNLSLLIVSDEPWIPWEMVLPHEADLPAEDFLCAQFRMTRWLDGRGLPDGLNVSNAQVVVPQSNLPSVKMEQDFFSQQLPPTVGFSGQWLDTASQVKDALRQGSNHWFHFACHGDFDYARPDESALQLQGDSLTPSQIVGPMRTGVAASRPLVFLNACHTAEAAFSLTRMGGWAERFVRAGASAFIGSLWEVNDVLAAEFAIKFYDEMLAGQTLGDAFHAARIHIRELDEANPTWLAYTLYADPNGKVKSQ